MDIDVVILFLLFVVIVLIIAMLAYLASQAYIHQDFTQALLHILTGDDMAKWPTRKDDMKEVTDNVIKALGGNGRPDNLVIKMPERRPPIEGGIRPEPQSYDEELSDIAEINNVNYQTGVGPSVGAK